MKPFQVACSLLSLMAFGTTQNALAQGLPTSQPKMITIIREQVKPGRSAEHAKHEAGWPAAFEKANSPDFYIGVTSLTGPTEAWYIVPRESHAAEAESMKREDKDPALSGELAKLAARDAEFINGITVIQAVARPDLSVGAFPDTSKVRFFQIGTFSVRPGQNDKFDSMAKTYGKMRLRAAPKSSYRVYSVIAGMPTPAYIVFSSVDDYAQFDQMMADSISTFASATEDEKAEFATFGEVVSKEENNRFRVDPKQSYVPKETRQKDPDFWTAK